MPKTKQVKREEAAARQETYDKLSLEEKLQRAEQGGGKKEITRLKKRIADTKTSPDERGEKRKPGGRKK